jgi:hypothetical protein
VVAKKSAPALSVSNTTLKGFTVNWNPISGATGYRVSTDSGKTFIIPTSGSMGLSHIISSMKGGEALKVQFKALVNDACGETETAEISGMSDTCKPISYSVFVAKSPLCLYEQANITIKGLSGMKYGVKLNNGPVGKDTILKPVIYGTTLFDILVIDSARLECGYTSKKLIITEDRVSMPVTTLNNAPQFKICTNNAIESINVQASFALFQDTVIWYKNGIRDGVGLSHTFSVKNGDVVFAQAKTKGGCIADSKSTTVVLQTLPNAGFSFAPNGSVYQFTANEKSGKHTWISPVTITSDSAYAAADFSSFQGQTVTVAHTVLLNGCEASDSQSINIISLGYRASSESHTFRVYPNPANEKFIIEYQGESTAQVELFDITGKKLEDRIILHKGINHISAENIPNGIYLISVKSINSVKRKNITIYK